MVRISIIIPTYNEEKYIGRTLEAIRRQSYKNIEVILADSSSADRTVKIARSRYRGIRICTTRERGISRACNRAARMAGGDVIVFVEADTSVSGGLLAAYDRAFMDRGVVAATGPIRPLEKTSLGNRIGFKIVSVYLAKLSFMLGKPTITGSNFAVRKSAFRRVHGLDESLITYQDWDLAHRLNGVGKVVFVDGAVSYTSVRRVEKWGAWKYFTFHAGNALRYSLTHRTRSDYGDIR